MRPAWLERLRSGADSLADPCVVKAGYFEPIPTHWSDQLSNPLKFTIEAAGGWRGITPAWRGYEDTAEERLYWVLNHREGVATTRMKPDFISEVRYDTIVPCAVAHPTSRPR